MGKDENEQEAKRSPRRANVRLIDKDGRPSSPRSDGHA